MFAFLISLAMSFVMYLITPAQVSDNNTTLEEFTISTADIDRIYPILYGTAKIDGANCTWYGDFRTEKIKQGDGGWIGTGIGEKYHDTGKIRHFIGFKLSICYGKAILHKIQSDSYTLWENINKVEGSFSSRIDKPHVYGEDDNVISDFNFWNGTQETEDPYLKKHILESAVGYDINKIMSWNGIAQFVFKGGETGLSKTLRGYKLTTSRCFTPEPFIDSARDISTIVDEETGFYSMNPIFIIYDLMTNKEYGAGQDESDINLENFKEVAELCFDEGWGLSVYVDSSRSVRELIDDILKYPNLMFRMNKETNKFEIVAIRDDYVFEELPVFDITNILSISNYTTGSVDNKLNEVRINYTDFNNFEANTETFQNEGVRFEKSDVSSTTIDYKYLNSAEKAALVAQREALPLTSELSEITIDVSFESGRLLNTGDVFVFNFEPYSVFNKVFRVKKVEFSEGGKYAARITAMQDHFGLTHTTSEPSPKSNWGKPDASVVPMDLQVIEAPRFFSRESQKVYCFGEKPINKLTGFELWINEKFDSNAFDFAPTAAVLDTYSKSEETEMIVSGDLTHFNSYTEDDLEKGANMMVFDTEEGLEFASFKTFEYFEGNWKIKGLKRGCLDTLPKNINTSTRIFFTYYGAAVSQQSELEIGNTYQINALTKISESKKLKIEDSVDIFKQINNRKDRPICPAGLRVNGLFFNETIGLDDELSLTWHIRNKVNQNVFKSFSLDNEELLENGTVYSLTILDENDNVLKQIETTETSFDFTDEKELNLDQYFNTLKIVLFAKNGTLESFEKYDFTVSRK